RLCSDPSWVPISRQQGPLQGRSVASATAWVDIQTKRTLSVASPMILSRSGRQVEALLALSAYSLIVLTRAWGSQRYVRGDDARMLNEALTHPWKSILEPYAGYLQVVPRFVVQLISQLPVNAMPVAIFIASLALWVTAARGIEILVARLTGEPLRGLAAGV